MKVDVFIALLAVILFPAIAYVWFHRSMFGGNPGFKEAPLTWGRMLLTAGLALVFVFFACENSEASIVMHGFLDIPGHNRHTVLHGAYHGFMDGLFYVTPVIAVNGVFESKKLSTILISCGYWIVSLTLSGALIFAAL